MIPDFNFIKDARSRNHIVNAYHAVNKCKAWDFMKKYNPEEVGGFMFCSHPIVYKISEEMNICPPCPPNHSGHTFSKTMKDIQKIAKEGYDKYINDIISEN